jgi:hypothetical protein
MPESVIQIFVKKHCIIKNYILSIENHYKEGLRLLKKTKDLLGPEGPIYKKKLSTGP